MKSEISYIFAQSAIVVARDALAKEMDFNNVLGFQIERNRRDEYKHKDQYEEYSNQDEQFYRRYRFKKETVKLLAELLRPEIEPKSRTNNAFTTEQRVCLALRFYASGTFQQQVGDGEGASQSTMCRVVEKVSTALASHADTLINFPVDEEMFPEISQRFYGFKGRKFI